MKLKILFLCGSIAGPACVMSRVLQPLVHVLQQHGIGRVTHVQARLVQQSHDAIVRQVNQLANDLKKWEFVKKKF